MTLIIIHRFLQSLIFPPLNAMLIMFLGLIIIHFRKKIGVIIIIFGLLFMYVQSIPIVAYYLTKNIEQPPLDESKLKVASAIVVLGGGVNGNGYEYIHGISTKPATLIRLNYAAYLAHKDPNKLLITSGGYTGLYRDARVMKDYLTHDFGVTNPIILEDKSRNTDENAEYVAKILLPLHIKSVILVTQAYHMKRSVELFKKHGLNPISASTDYYENYDAQTPVLAFLPTAGSINQISNIAHEYIGYYLYKE